MKVSRRANKVADGHVSDELGPQLGLRISSQVSSRTVVRPDREREGEGCSVMCQGNEIKAPALVKNPELCRQLRKL